MSAISDKIISAGIELGEQIAGNVSNWRAQEQTMREMIADALAEARREGAEAMRDIIKHQAEINALYGVTAITLSTICALPLPTGERQAVHLSHAEIAEAFLSCCPAHLRSAHDARDMQARPDVIELGRAIETAVLAANNLEVRRG